MDDEVNDATVWRILTWNLHGSARPDLRAIAAAVSSFRPDVVALQELQRRQAASLAAELGWQHRWSRKHYPFSPFVWWRAEGLAIMTPHSLQAPRRRSITPGVSTWTYRHRIVLAATVARDAGSSGLRLYDTHLASHDAPDDRIAQARRVTEMVLAEAEPLRVVAGDLNAAGEAEVIREFHPAGLRDPGGGPTHPSIGARQRFDYVLVPDTATVTDRSELAGDENWWELSDHLPVLVEFRCAPSTGAAPSP